MGETLLMPYLKKQFALGLTNNDWSGDGNLQSNTSELPGIDMLLKGITPITGIIPAYIWNSFRAPVTVTPVGFWTGGNIGGNAAVNPSGATQTVISLNTATAGGVAVTNATNPVIYSNPAGKTAYITSLTFTINGANNAGRVDFTDNVAGFPANNQGLSIEVPANDTAQHTITFPQAPLKFLTNITMNTNIGSVSIVYTIVGWQQ